MEKIREHIYKGLIALFVFLFWFLLIGPSIGGLIVGILAAAFILKWMNKRKKFNDEFEGMQTPDMWEYLSQTPERKEDLRFEAHTPKAQANSPEEKEGPGETYSISRINAIGSNGFQQVD